MRRRDNNAGLFFPAFMGITIALSAGVLFRSALPGPATTHFGPQAIHGVVSHVSTG